MWAIAPRKKFDSRRSGVERSLAMVQALIHGQFWTQTVGACMAFTRPYQALCVCVVVVCVWGGCCSARGAGRLIAGLVNAAAGRRRQRARGGQNLEDSAGEVDLAL